MCKVLFVSCLLLLTSCSSTIQSASIFEAYKKYESQEYKQTLVLLSRAENTKSMAPEMKAETTYLKALTLEQLGQQDTAVTLYEYLKQQHADSQYGHLATKRLEKTF